MAKTRKSAGGEKSKPSDPLRKGPAKPAGDGAAQLKLPRKVKTHLSRKELDDYRQVLLQKRQTLLGDLSGMEQQTSSQGASGNLSSMPTHMADVGTDNFEQEFTLGLLESEQQLLREIDEALRRIDERTYGVCLGTGNPIPKARLLAKPWAKYTVEYARMLEKGLVRPPDEHPAGGDGDGEEADEAEADEHEDEDEHADAGVEDENESAPDDEE